MFDYFLGLYEKAMPDDLSLEEKLLTAKELGYDHMELCIDMNLERQKRLDWTKEERKYWANFTRDNGIPVRTFSLSAMRGCPLGICDDAMNEKAFVMLEKAAILATELGSRVILFNGYDVYDEPSTPETRARFVANLHKAAAIGEKYGIILGLENADKEICDSVAKTAYYTDQINSPYLKVFADTGNIANFALGDMDVATADLESGAGKIAAMHLKDSEIGEYRFTKYGEGHVDFARNIETIKNIHVRMFTAELFYYEGMDYKAEGKRVNEFLRSFLDA